MLDSLEQQLCLSCFTWLGQQVSICEAASNTCSEHPIHHHCVSKLKEERILPLLLFPLGKKGALVMQRSLWERRGALV